MPQHWRVGTTRIQALEVEACWRPATGELAGDFHELVDLRDGLVAVVVGDVMGFGPTASRVAGLLVGELRAAFRESADAAAVLRLLDHVVSDAADDAIVTAVCVVVDSRDGSAVISNAGHMPLVFAGESSAALCDEPPDPPLGLRYEGRSAFVRRLAPEQTVFALTDGLVERKGQSLDAALAALAEAGRGGIRGPCQGATDLARRAGDLFGPPSDDATVVSLRLVDHHPASPFDR